MQMIEANWGGGAGGGGSLLGLLPTDREILVENVAVESNLGDSDH